MVIPSRSKAEMILKNWGRYVYLAAGLDEEINDLRYRIRRRTAPNAATYDREVKVTDIQKPTERAVTDIEELENCIKNFEKRLSELKANKEIADYFLNTLEATERLLIEMRYRRGKAWQAISKKIYLSTRQCFRIRNKILDRLGEFAESV